MTSNDFPEILQVDLGILIFLPYPLGQLKWRKTIELTPFQIFIAFFIFLCLERFIELIITYLNRLWIIKAGGKEYAGTYTYLYLGFHVIWMTAFFAEGLLSGATLQAPAGLIAAIFASLQAFRYWSIFTLGRFWSVRITVLPGEKRISGGPYKYFKHPTYVVVMHELMIYPLLFGCNITALWGTIIHIPLLLLRISGEEEALAELTE